MKRSQNDEVHPADLQAKFGEDASLYAQVRAEAAAAAGRTHASEEWEKAADELAEGEATGADEEPPTPHRSR